MDSLQLGQPMLSDTDLKHGVTDMQDGDFEIGFENATVEFHTDFTDKGDWSDCKIEITSIYLHDMDGTIITDWNEKSIIVEIEKYL